MVPFIVDANAIHEFQSERIRQENGPAHSAIIGILDSHFIALDADGKCLQEWAACAEGTHPFALTDWIADQMLENKIRLVDIAPNTCRKQLLTLGLPEQDHKWIRLCVGASSERLVTEDVDFFNPRAKTWKANAKMKLKAAKKGPCAKALKKQFRISVMCLAHVPDELVSLQSS
jgi:hypothetical protein